MAATADKLGPIGPLAAVGSGSESDAEGTPVLAESVFQGFIGIKRLDLNQRPSAPRKPMHQTAPRPETGQMLRERI